MKRLTIFLLSIILLISCNEVFDSPNGVSVNGNNKLKDKGNRLLYSHNYSGVWNSNNPYDSIGYWHNEALDYIADNKDDIDSNNVWNSVKNIISDFGQDRGYSTNEINSIFNNFESIVYEYEDIESDISGFYDDEDVFSSQSSLTFIDDLYDIPERYKDSTNLNNYFSDIMLVESNIISSGLPSGDKKILLETASILRFSTKYWDEVRDDISHNWRDIDSDGQPLSITCEEVLKLGISDAIGCYTGGCIGAVTATAATALYLFWNDVINFLEAVWNAIFG